MTLEQRNNTGFGAPILQVAENPPIINSQPSTNRVPHLRYQPTLDSHLQIQLTSDRVVLQSLLSKKEKNLCVSGPMKFKPVIVQGSTAQRSVPIPHILYPILHLNISGNLFLN